MFPKRRLATASLGMSAVALMLGVTLQAEEPISPETAQGESSAEINNLVRKLGDSDFNVREQASARLFEIGEPALPAIKAAADSADAEAAVRARELLSQIPRKAINLWKDRLIQPSFDIDLFLIADSQRFIETGDIGGSKPPLLTYYRRAFGDKRVAREYYVTLLRKKPSPLLIGQNYLNATPGASQRDPLQQAFVELLELEVEKIAQEQKERSKAKPFHWRGEFHDDISAVMIVHAATEPELSAKSYGSLAFRTKIQSKPRDARTAKGRIRNLITKNDLQRQMLRPILEHCWSKVTTPRAAYNGMELFAYFGWNRSALQLARRTVELSQQPAFADRESKPDVVGSKALDYPVKAQFLAAHHLLIFGGKDDIPVAAQLLKQGGAVRVIARPPGIPRGPNLEVRELALTALAKFNDQEPEKLGMVENKVYCPVAHTAKAFYLPDAAMWPKIISRFSPDAASTGETEEARPSPED